MPKRPDKFEIVGVAIKKDASNYSHIIYMTINGKRLKCYISNKVTKGKTYYSIYAPKEVGADEFTDFKLLKYTPADTNPKTSAKTS
tara:strand:- start:1389 stop:1646 length:258 start_codon:yes stop_codon:yes gene_type:complete